MAFAVEQLVGSLPGVQLYLVVAWKSDKNFLSQSGIITPGNFPAEIVVAEGGFSFPF